MNPTVKPSIQEIAIASVYARSALKLAEASGESETILSEVDELAAALDRDRAFDTFMHSPLIEAEARSASLDRMFRGRMNEILLDTLQVMNRKGRSALVRAFIEAFRHEYEEVRGQVRARVRSAVPLTEALRRSLAQAVSEYTGKSARLEELVDESLIGGLVLLIGDCKIDTSVVKEIGDLRHQLLERASHEIQRGRTYIEDVS